MSQRNRSSTQNSPQSKRPALARSSDTLLSEEEDDDMQFTQPSTSQVQKGLEKLTPVQLDHKTAEVIQYFLVKDQRKIPVRRADIVKFVLKEHRNVYAEVLRRAERTFKEVYGVKIVEIDTKTHVYILVNELETAEEAPLSISAGNPNMGLLFVILSVIFMKGGVVKEAVIWNILKKLRVDLREKHGELGDVKKVVTDEFVRQRYLEYAKVPHSEPVEHQFLWGQRAEYEVSKVKILEYMGQLHGQSPQSWSQQYRQATNPNAASSSQPSTSSQR
ncbi:necdin-like 2 [Lampris incognitus]|uniref:necdin-like 2 n=1 Tax=Lampris incognitus TaxID=2546036 RepID=UPI0024B52AA5|nr:necdin-like 2 [Lampris incognitus]XP_056130416.1 necdin-like 2 [Lampris incognitus]XP_056130417.1 necdin-like 2 [Lampris incognitus]